VHFDGYRTKVSKSVNIGDIYQVQQSLTKKTVEVLALNDTRKSASEAQLLYKETDESIKSRENETQIRQATGFISSEKPTKKQRRQIINFKNE
jgi:ribosome-associated heat shock protein Hsp15